MSFEDTQNQYYRTTIVIDRFADGTQELALNETELMRPPCVTGGCRASSFGQEHCEFDPKTGLCNGKMA